MTAASPARRAPPVLDLEHLERIARELAAPLLELVSGFDADVGRQSDLPEPRELTLRLPDGSNVSLDEALELILDRHLQQLVDADRVSEARHLLSLLGEDTALPVVQRWRAALERPVARLSEAATGRNPRADAAWLQRHGAEHAGCWVALRDGHLVDSDRDVRALSGRLRDRSLLEGTVLLRVPD